VLPRDCARTGAQRLLPALAGHVHALRGPPPGVADVLEPVDLIAWDSLRLGNGYRTRRRGDYLLVQQKPPLRAKATWRDHGIPNRWPEKVDRKIHPHVKPQGLIERLIAAVTLPGDLVIDPAAGGFGVLTACLRLGREFIGCDVDAATVARFGGGLL
jgi:site-specific DNA-methyltransferase (adenine-specific)